MIELASWVQSNVVKWALQEQNTDHHHSAAQLHTATRGSAILAINELVLQGVENQ
jgi:hypothetical protein